MKTKIIAKSKEHLEELIIKEVDLHGDSCDLNHIDVSNVESMRGLFYFSKFNGNISKWDVSKVEDMCYMFAHSHFKGDISKWNTASLKHTEEMFNESVFNSDISKWDVSKVTFMNSMFRNSNFTRDLSDWTPVNLQACNKDTLGLQNNLPYWTQYEDQDSRNCAIDSYQLNKHLNKTLDTNNNSKKKIKI